MRAMGMLVQRHIGLLVFLVFAFSLNPQLSFSSSSNATLPNSPFLCHPLQSHALLLFKSNFVIDPSASWYCQPTYPKTESWKEGTDCCSSWDGVTCDVVTGHVIELDLSCSQLVGTIHSNNTLFSSHVAPYLHRLNLAWNNFTGSEISVGVVFGSSLTHLNLSWSGFSGNISSEISHLSNLVSLDISYSHFTGNIPYEISLLSSLVSLDLHGNYGLVVESDRVLENIARNLTHLMVLNLDGVDMSSLHASSLMNLSTSLTSLHLSSCGLQGEFPDRFLVFPNLQELDLSYNNFNEVTFISYFNSTTPTSSNLFFLDMSHTNFSLLSSIGFVDFVGNYHTSLSYLGLRGCNINGPIPPSFSNLTKLTRLNLAENNFSGPISPLFGNLTQLSQLRLSHNHLSGPIPTFFSNLTHLAHLILASNELEGPLPSYLFALKFLIAIDLSNNKLHGHIPTSPVDSMDLTYLNLSNNSLSGSLDFDVLSSFRKLSGVISSSICNLSHLTIFDLSYNQFTGSIPQCLVNMTSLWDLDLGMNELHGVIPNTFATDSELLSLVLKRNQLTGPMPPSLAHCEKLGMLDLGNNMIEDTVPHWLEKLSSLEVLILRSNKFFGSLNTFKPKFFSPSLRILDLSKNNFGGQLPINLLTALSALTNVDEKLQDGYPYMGGSYKNGGMIYSMEITSKGSELEYVRIPTTFGAIDLSRNKFEGHIPREFGKLISLIGLNLSHNLLTGHIPSSMGGLVNLEWLDLSSNKLNGQIPKELSNMTFLSVLNLSHNQLDGSIPQGKQFDTFTNDSYKDNLALCGLPLSKSCGPNHEPSSVAPENKDSSNSESGFNWEGAFAGYGCGVVLGLSIGYIVFETGKPKWFVRMVDGKKQGGRVGKRPRRGGRRRN